MGKSVRKVHYTGAMKRGQESISVVPVAHQGRKDILCQPPRDREYGVRLRGAPRGKEYNSRGMGYTCQAMCQDALPVLSGHRV